jgi:hypothetical protein
VELALGMVKPARAGPTVRPAIDRAVSAAGARSREGVSRNVERLGPTDCDERFTPALRRIAGAAMLVVAETDHGPRHAAVAVVGIGERTADRGWLGILRGRLDEDLTVVRLTDQVVTPMRSGVSRLFHLRSPKAR